MPSDKDRDIPFIPLYPGDKVFFERKVGERKVRTSATFIGLKGRDYVLTEQPMVSGAPIFSAAGAPCVVRFLYQGVVHGFTSNVAYIVFNPFPMLCINYPRELETINLRGEKRFAVSISATVCYQELGETKTLEGTISDLSVSGCRLELPLFFDAGDVLDLSFRLLDGQEVKGLPGEVRNLRSNGDGRFEFGVRFQDPHPELGEFVKRLAALSGGA